MKKTKQSFVPLLKYHWLGGSYDIILFFSGLGIWFKRKITSYADRHKDVCEIADLGCGTGTQLQAIREQFPLAQITGIDPDANLLKSIQEKHMDPSLALYEAYMQDLPFPSDKFDLCFCTLTLHHLASEDKLLALQEAFRVIKPGGQFILTDWGVSRIPFMQSLLIFEEAKKTADHFANKIPLYIEEADFFIEQSIRVKPSGIWTWVLRKPK